MAEGGELTSINDGSDADFDVTCTPCGEDDIRAEAYKYCVECQEYLCTTCTRHHGRLKASQSHKLLDKDAVRQGSTVAMTTKCRYHPERDIEMYCETHDMVYCAKCVAKEHRTCSRVSDIEDVQPTPAQQNAIQRLKDDTRHIQERLADINKKTQKKKESLEEQRGNNLAKIEEVARSLVEHIRKLKHEATDTLNKDYALVKDELKSNITVIASMTNEVENASSQFENFSSMEAGQQFVQMKLIQATVNDAVKVVEDSEAKESQTLCFTESSDLKTSVMETTFLGRVNTSVPQQNVPRVSTRLPKVKSRKEINVRMQSDQSICFISGVCQLQDGTIILADQNNKKIKRLDLNYSIRDQYDLDAYPLGICCTGQNEVAVKLNNAKVQFIAVGNSMSKQREISIDNRCWWFGMAYCAGELWIPTDNKSVSVHSTSGSLIKTISKDANGLNIFRSVPWHMAVTGETVIVADSSDVAVCLQRDGTVIRKLRDGRLVETGGVCVSSDDTMFLSGYRSNNIVMFDKNGKCLGELVAKDAGLVDPVALLYDDKRHYLIVTCCNSDKITTFDMSD